jgi:hypothetical protein
MGSSKLYNDFSWFQTLCKRAARYPFDILQQIIYNIGNIELFGCDPINV